MQVNIVELLKLFVPGIIAVLGNVGFYIVIKGKVDKAIEKHKISYSGVFKERIDIYRELLKRTYDIKLKVQQYQYFGSDRFASEIQEDFNKYIQFYLTNQPFLSEKIVEDLKRIREELQLCFENFFMHNSLHSEVDVPKETRTELLNKYFDSGNKFKLDQPFEALENNIIAEMRRDLQIDKL